MYCTIRNVLFFLLLVLFVFGCGKGQKIGTRSTLTTNDGAAKSVPSMEFIASDGSGLRPEIEFDYDYSGCTSNDGFTVVPMADDVSDIVMLLQ